MGHHLLVNAGPRSWPRTGLENPWSALAAGLVGFVRIDEDGKLRDHCSPKSAIHIEFLCSSWEDTTVGRDAGEPSNTRVVDGSLV